MPVVEFTCMPGESYCKWLGSLLCFCEGFWALINSLRVNSAQAFWALFCFRYWLSFNLLNWTMWQEICQLLKCQYSNVCLIWSVALCFFFKFRNILTLTCLVLFSFFLAIWVYFEMLSKSDCFEILACTNNFACHRFTNMACWLIVLLFIYRGINIFPVS